MGRVLLAEAAAEEPRKWRGAERQALVQVIEGLATEGPGWQGRSLPVPGAGNGLRVTRISQEHELVFRFGDGRDLEIHDVIRPSAEAAGDQPPVLAHVSRGQLLGLGVPAPLLRVVRGVRAAGELSELGLPPDVVERLTVHFQAGTATSLQAVPEFLKFRVESFTVLKDYYLGNLSSLLLNLTAEQERIVRLDAQGPVLVNGVAGSGKTTVALYRLRRLLEAGGGLLGERILYLTYNKSLARVAEQLLRELRVPDGAVEVRNVHRWAQGALKSRLEARRHGESHRVILDGKPQRDVLHAAIEDVRSAGHTASILDADPDFWFAEFSDVLKGREVRSIDEYLTLDRFGRGLGLAAPARQAVWAVYQAYERRRGGRLDWDDVVAKALARVRAGAVERYRHVFVDEAQDLTPAAMVLARELAEGTSPSLFITADPSQSIYRRGFRWIDVGVHVTGRSHTLSRNYRGTEQILAAARPVWEGTDGGTREGIPPEGSRRQGPKPRLVTCRNVGEQLAWVTDEIRQLLRDGGARPGNIAVLARTRAILRQAEQRLGGAGIPVALYTDQIDLSDPRVKLVTIHSAKGLEFPIVFVVGVDQATFFPRWDALSPEDREATVVRERKVLYVAMTRAMQDLTLLYSAGRGASVLLDLIPPEAVIQVEHGVLGSAVAISLPTPEVPPREAPTASGLEVIDKRGQGGALWVVGSRELEPTLREAYPGVSFTFSPSGGRATGNRPAWWVKG